MKFYYLFISLLCTIAFSSCDFIGDNSNQKEVEVKQIVELPDSVKQHIIKQDSLYCGLIAKIDTLTMALNTSQQEVAKLQQNFEKLESPKSFWNYMTVGALILAFIAIILNFAHCGLSENKVRRCIKEYLDSSKRINDFQRKINDIESKLVNSNSNSRYMPTGPISRKAEDRIVYLEGKIKEVIDAVNRHEAEIKNRDISTSTTQVSKSTSQQKKEFEYKKDGYAKLNSGAYFMEILDSNQEGCVFHINFKSQNKGEFNIISLDKIKSRNEWKNVIEATGNCTIEDATSYKVEEMGICEKLSDGKTWEMKRKLRIKISK